MNDVGSAAPFQSTAAAEANPVPFTVSVNVGPPGATEGGLRLVIESVAGVTVKVIAFDVVPPVVTVMLAVPAAATKPAFTVAFTCVELRNVVGSPLPFHCTCASDPNPVPFTVSVNWVLPAATDVGLRLVMEFCALAQTIRLK